MRGPQRGRAYGPNNDLFRLSCELNPKQRGGIQQVGHYDATGKAKATVSNTTTVRRYQSRTPGQAAKEGIGALYIGGTGDYCEFPYTANPGGVFAGLGNALRGRNWSVGGWWGCATGLASAAYLVSVQDSGRTAAGTAFKFTIDGSGTPFFHVSDGTTVFTIGPQAGTGQAAAALNAYLFAECVNGVIHFSCNGVVLNSVKFDRDVNCPSGAVLRFGKSVAGDLTLFEGFADMWQIKPDHLYSGANFTPPTWPVPYRKQARTAALPLPAVQLRFEASPGFLVDEGTAGSTWTNSNGVNATSTPKEGSKYLTFASNTPLATYYLDTAATSSNSPSGTGNWAMGGWFQQFVDGGGNTGYIMGIREGAASASETGVFLYRGGAGNNFFFFYSDGSTVNSIDSGVPATTTGVWNHLWVERFGNKIYFYVNGVLKNAGGTSFTGSINLPSGSPRLRIGSAAYTAGGGAANMVAAADVVQIYKSSLYSGASSFTPPVLGR